MTIKPDLGAESRALGAVAVFSMQTSGQLESSANESSSDAANDDLIKVLLVNGDVEASLRGCPRSGAFVHAIARRAGVCVGVSLPGPVRADAKWCLTYTANSDPTQQIRRRASSSGLLRGWLCHASSVDDQPEEQVQPREDCRARPTC